MAMMIPSSQLHSWNLISLDPFWSSGLRRHGVRATWWCHRCQCGDFGREGGVQTAPEAVGIWGRCHRKNTLLFNLMCNTSVVVYMYISILKVCCIFTTYHWTIAIFSPTCCRLQPGRWNCRPSNFSGMMTVLSVRLLNHLLYFFMGSATWNWRWLH